MGDLYKVSPSKFVLVFVSKAAKEKLQGTEIQCRFGDSEVCLNFRKRIGPLRNGREPIFVTILLPPSSFIQCLLVIEVTRTLNLS